MTAVNFVNIKHEFSGFSHGTGTSILGRRCRAHRSNDDKCETLKLSEWAPIARPTVKSPRYVQTQKGVPTFTNTIPANPCPDCQGSGKTTCGACRGKARLNYRHVNMLPSGVSIEWCPHCRATGKWFCSSCMGTGKRREPIGFRFEHE